MRSSLNVLAGIIGLLSICKDSLQGYHEKRLLNSFFGPGSNYSNMERPILNESLALPVHFGLTLQQIMDVDERNQLLSTTLWITMEWNDYNLKWNSSEYGGLSDIRVHPDKVWKPDVLLYNSADERFENTFHSNVVVYSTGDCVYIPPGIFKSTCKINIKWFPFDEQHCTLKFGSWSYDGNRIDLQLKKNEADLSGFMKNGEWELIGVPAQRNVITYECCPEPYVDVTFTIIIRRRVLFYVFNLVLPCALISSITLLGFCLPVESGEKLTLGVTILLSLTVFLLMVAESMPATSDAVPLLGTYFSLIMMMTGLSVVLTVIVLNVHFRTPQTHVMHPWVRKILLVWLPFILGLKRPGPMPNMCPPKPKICRSCFKTVNANNVNSDKNHGRSLNALDLESRSCSLLANVLELDDRPKSLQLLNHNTFSSPDHQYVVRRRSRPQQSGRVENVEDILTEVRYVADRMRAEDTDMITTNDWKFAAMVLDRLFLWIIVMFTIGFTGGVLMSAPHFQV
ncbi:neuronal acetylcholine receptor subunit alpha-7-like isoform X2 [Paramacrobiotus metropolitanus]|uniref:neuronal acetylcholine receptor subunit alpha-7-like isoform X2 n=1 Tax=Paramacrobiotus metropolitanus TaxID=2943436 RepID=UPI002445CA7A|nr:neuronal acetylcholine receptor subunit alpha-7-like isoform X2 [Paramacrobiotus metropolitanus]